jgi:hypothetical protein
MSRNNAQRNTLIVCALLEFIVLAVFLYQTLR